MIAVGVDTHKQQHHAVALDGLGQILGEIVIASTLAGYSQFVCWLKDLGGNVLVGIEGAGSYGAGLCEFLQAEEIEVFEVERPQRRERRGGKSDRIDALLAAKKVLTREGLSTPRGSGKRLALQMLLAGYRSIVSERSRLYNQLQALQISAPYALRERIGQTRNGAALADRLTGMRTRPTATQQENLTLQVLRDIANSARALDTEAENYTHQIEEMARSLAPALLEEPGVGPICAGRLLAFNPSRFTSEAAFARANGTAPQPASSGKDRQTPSQPRRRPASQRSDLHDRALPLSPPPPKPRLHPTQDHRRKDQTRGHAIPKATPLPPPLQPTRKNTLDNIEASKNIFRAGPAKRLIDLRPS